MRVDNSVAWRPMSVVMELLPRVVHPKDLHFVCGVSAVEDLENGSFSFHKIRRGKFYMYPEEAQVRECNLRALCGSVSRVCSKVLGTLCRTMGIRVLDLFRYHGQQRACHSLK